MYSMSTKRTMTQTDTIYKRFSNNLHVWNPRDPEKQSA